MNESETIRHNQGHWRQVQRLNFSASLDSEIDYLKTRVDLYERIIENEFFNESITLKAWHDSMQRAKDKIKLIQRLIDEGTE